MNAPPSWKQRRSGRSEFYSAFLRKEGRAEISDIVKHILYMIDKAGEDAVALGTDFDGFSKEALPGEIRDVEDMWKLWERLERAGLTGDRLKNLHPETFCGL